MEGDLSGKTCLEPYKESVHTYQEIRKELKEHKPSYTNNMHFSSIMKENFGALKAFVIGRLIPLCYPAARMICLAVMR